MADKLYLTPRERQLVRFICFNYKDIVRRLNTTKGSVEHGFRSMRVRMNTHHGASLQNNVGLLWFALARGLVEIDEIIVNECGADIMDKREKPWINMSPTLHANPYTTSGSNSSNN